MADYYTNLSIVVPVDDPAAAVADPAPPSTRFPKATGQFIVVTETEHASGRPRQVRIAVDFITLYQPAVGPVTGHEGGSTMIVSGRPVPIRLVQSVEELDALIAAMPARPKGVFRWDDPLHFGTAGLVPFDLDRSTTQEPPHG